MADRGEPQEITALRRNLTSITAVATVGGNLQWFANCLVEKEFIARETAQGILGAVGATPADQANRLLDGVFAKIRVSEEKRDMFDMFVSIFSSDLAYTELVGKLKRSVSSGVGRPAVDLNPATLRSATTTALLTPTPLAAALAMSRSRFSPLLWVNSSLKQRLQGGTARPSSQNAPAAPSPPATEESPNPRSTITSSSFSASPDNTPLSSDQPSTSSFWSLQKVKSTIENLEEMFGNIHAEAGTELTEKESKDKMFFKRFRSRLLLLPVRKATLHVKFFDANEDEILAAKNTTKVLAILCRFVDYRNFEILYYIIVKFCSTQLQESMNKFCKMLEEFETATTVDVYLSAIPDEVDEELLNGFSEMVVKIDKPESQCTLLEIRKLNKAIIEKSTLCSHSVYIGAVSSNCVVVRFRFPSTAVGWVMAPITPEFMAMYHMTEVAVDGRQLSPVRVKKEELNEVLISASGSGDVMTVASLLNSGADIQTEDRFSRTPLISASVKGHLQVIRLLTSRGVGVDSRTVWSQLTPLMSAARHGEINSVTELISLGADVNIQSRFGDTALIIAEIHGHTNVVKELVKAGTNLELQNKVKGFLKTNSVNPLQRVQLQKIKGIIPPPVMKIKGRSSFKGRNRQRHKEKEEKKSRQKLWVLGKFSGEGVKDRRKGDEEELKDLRSMGVVKKRLRERERFRVTERERVREQAIKFFKHRYVLDPKSTQKSNTILVTGYEPSANKRSTVELVRQQSSIVISNILDQPTHPVVFSGLSEVEKENLERVVVSSKGGRGREFSPKPITSGGQGVREESGGTTGTTKVHFSGSSFKGIAEENGHHDDDDHEISKAKHVRTKSAPHKTTSLAQPSSELLDKTPPPLPPPPPMMMMAAASVTSPDSTPVSGMENGRGNIPSSPPVLVRTPSNVSAMETDEVEEVNDAVSVAKSDAVSMTKSRPKPRKRRSPQSPRQSPLSPAKKHPRKERFFFKKRKKERERMEEENIGNYLALSYNASSMEGVELMGSNIHIESFPVGRSDYTRGEKRESFSLAEPLKAKPRSLSQKVPPTFEPLKPLQPFEPLKPLQPLHPLKRPRPLDISKPPQSLDPSKPPRPLDPSQPPRPLEPLKPPQPLDPSKCLNCSQTSIADLPEPLTHHKLTPQFPITSLPGLNPTPKKYYTPISPRVDKITETYAGDTNPFAEDFDRLLHGKAASAAAKCPAPPVTHRNTQLPDEIMSNEGFLKFLEMHGARPSTSMYITYQIQLLSGQIDCEYEAQLNQAVDSMIPEIKTNNISWGNFSAVCRSLLFKGGLNDGILLVPAFAKRLLGFLPGMRDVITMYTQQVVEQYAMDWLLMRGGWGEVLRHRDEEQRREEKEREEEWVWPAEEWEESNGEQEEVKDSFYTSMGYSLVTPGPEDMGDVFDKQVGDHDDGPHPQDPLIAMTMGSELFLGPVQEITPPIGRGLRRVISVEVLFTTSGSSGCLETDFTLRRASLSRASSLPSICSSIPTPSSPISTPSPRKHPSADYSSGSPSSPVIFTLPSMRKRPRPLDSTRSLATSFSSFHRRQSLTSVESSSIRLVGEAMSPTPSSPLISRAKLDIKSSRLVSTVTKDESGTNQATLTPNKGTQPSIPFEVLATLQHDGIHDNRQTTPSNNEPNQISVQRSVTSSSEGSYANYSLEPDHGHVTEWEWKWIAISAFLLAASAGITVAFFVFRKR